MKEIHQEHIVSPEVPRQTLAIDSEASKLLQTASSSKVTSIHGESGTGKSLLAAYLVYSHLDSGGTVTAVLLGPGGQLAQFLNQTMGIGLDLYCHLRAGSLQVFERQPMPFHQLMCLVLSLPSQDMVLVDHVELTIDVTVADMERAMSWLLRSRVPHIIFVAGTDVGKQRDYADLQIDLSHSGRDVERAQADAILEIRAGRTRITRSLRVAATGLEVWQG